MRDGEAVRAVLEMEGSCGVTTPAACAFLGRRWWCEAGGNSVDNTGPESTVPPAASGGGGAGLRAAGATAGEGRA